MTINSHALSISFAVCSLLNGCTQASDGVPVDESTRAYNENRKLVGGSMLSAQERSELRQKMLSMKSYSECTEYVAHHYQVMLERAQENGSSRPINQMDICHRMKSAGMFR